MHDREGTVSKHANTLRRPFRKISRCITRSRKCLSCLSRKDKSGSSSSTTAEAFVFISPTISEPARPVNSQNHLQRQRRESITFRRRIFAIAEHTVGQDFEAVVPQAAVLQTVDLYHLSAAFRSDFKMVATRLGMSDTQTGRTVGTHSLYFRDFAVRQYKRVEHFLREGIDHEVMRE